MVFDEKEFVDYINEITEDEFMLLYFQLMNEIQENIDRGYKGFDYSKFYVNWRKLELILIVCKEKYPDRIEA